MLGGQGDTPVAAAAGKMAHVMARCSHCMADSAGPLPSTPPSHIPPSALPNLPQSRCLHHHNSTGRRGIRRRMQPRRHSVCFQHNTVMNSAADRGPSPGRESAGKGGRCGKALAPAKLPPRAHTPLPCSRAGINTFGQRPRLPSQWPPSPFDNERGSTGALRQFRTGILKCEHEGERQRHSPPLPSHTARGARGCTRLRACLRLHAAEALSLLLVVRLPVLVDDGHRQQDTGA